MKLNATSTLLLLLFTNIIGIFASIFASYTNSMKNKTVLIMNGIYGLILVLSIAVITTYLTGNEKYGLILGGVGLVLFILYLDAVTNRFGIWSSIMSKMG